MQRLCGKLCDCDLVVPALPMVKACGLNVLVAYRNMVTSLINHERIETTLPKAQALKRVADRMVTQGKLGTFIWRHLASHRDGTAAGGGWIHLRKCWPGSCSHSLH